MRSGIAGMSALPGNRCKQIRKIARIPGAAAYDARREDLLLRDEEGYPDFDIDRLIRMQNAPAEERIRAHEAQLRREPPSDMLPL